MAFEMERDIANLRSGHAPSAGILTDMAPLVQGRRLGRQTEGTEGNGFTRSHEATGHTEKIEACDRPAKRGSKPKEPEKTQTR
jgi:hypothetical protein